MIRVGIVGATGYTGVELLRLLLPHPGVEVAAVSSRAEAGRPVTAIFPSLRGATELRFAEPAAALFDDCELVFFATPHATAMKLVPELLRRGRRVIDLSADFRLRDPALWQQWYGEPHAAPELLSEAVYGLPEYHREAIREARLVACPGCYPTAVALGLLPLLEAGVVEPASLVADAKSGVSGAGRKAAVGSLLCEAGDSMKAYAVAGHRHLPEMLQTLHDFGDETARLVFVPHLTPMIRGIHATLYATLREPEADLQALFERRYREEPFVDVMEAGSHPETRSVRGANCCRLAVHRPAAETVVVLSVIDNLVKGAAGQAVQCLNLMTGQDERCGLDGLALLP